MNKQTLWGILGLLVIFCAGCSSSTIDAINPVVQAGKMQNSAQKTIDQVQYVHDYSLEMQRRELDNLEIKEEE